MVYNRFYLIFHLILVYFINTFIFNIITILINFINSKLNLILQISFMYFILVIDFLRNFS